MDVRIGLTQTPKELEVQLADDADPDSVREQFQQAIDGNSTLWLTDRRGRQIGIPTAKVAYVEIGSPDETRRVGFGG